MKIDLRSIEAFHEVSETSLQKIGENSELLNYSPGYPLCEYGIIPNRVLVIVKGTARLHYRSDHLSQSITKLGPYSFIGISSLLRVCGCEFVSASSEIIVLSIPDKIILELYKEDEKFQNWCNSKLQVSEVLALANHIYKDRYSTDLEIKNLVNSLISHLSIKTINNGERINCLEDTTCIIASSNIENKNIYELTKNNEIISTRGPLKARLFFIKNKLYEELFNKKVKNSVEQKQSEAQSSQNTSIKKGPFLPERTTEKIGQYRPEKKLKLIKANGSMRETLACIQMLANSLELPYRSDSVEKILRDAIKNEKKPSMQVLGGITAMMGLYSSTAKIDPVMADRLPTPSIISWGDNYAIVQESYANNLVIISPKEGIINLQSDQFKDSFPKGFIELLIVEKNEQTPETKFGFKWLLPAINKYRGVLLQVLLASFVVQLFGLANPLMIQVIIDKVISQRSLDTLQILGFALVVITILGGVISSLRTFLFNETTNRIDTRLGAEVIDHLLRIPLGYFDKRPVGELGSRIAELEKIRNFLTGQALTTILDAIFSLIYIVVMVIYSWLLTIIALGVVPIQILITILGTPLIRRQIREIAQENAKTQSHLVEVLTGIQTVKAQNVERVSRWKWQELYSKYISKSFEKTITGTALGETSQVLQQLSQLLVLWVGASLVLSGKLSLGQLIAFRIISGYVTQPLLRLSTIWQNIQELRVSFERLADIVDTPEESNELDREKIPLPSVQGNIEFENVCFKFNPGQPNVLEKIDLKISSGQFVGIVGQSGSGKSTLMKLLPRLYKPQSGRIKIDGYDIDKVELYSLRRQIGIVPQEPLLFAGNINDNIALTDPESKSDEIIKVAKIASAHDFIMELKDGYSTKVGERGAGLSGGQKQRIAIARTLLSNPKLLIMDEATSALDYETERKVCEGIRTSCLDATVFFITHRLSTVKNADIIIMLHEGMISEMGTHQDLINKKGRYFALYSQQESS